MKASQFLAFFLGITSISAVSLPESNARDLETLSTLVERSEILSLEHALEKRKGGGGKGGGGGGGGGKSGGGGTGGTGRSSSSSNQGGSTKQGTGPSRSYGGGYYGGGAAVPYSAGQKTSGKGLAAGGLIGLGVGGLLIFPGLWLYSVYPYYYSNPYRFYNQSYQNRTNSRRDTTTGANETLPVVCLCQEYSVCGCDENDDPNYLADLIGNGSYAALNKSLITVSEVNDTKTRSLVINGTLPNGTTAPGGTEDANGAALANLPFGRFTGYYALGLVATYAFALL